MLDPSWWPLIDDVARRLLGPRDLSGDALARAVRRVSEAYSRRAGDPAALRDEPGALAARLRFFLPRDLPKLAPPLRELAWAGALPAHRPLRVLDVGAGLGATALGAAAALATLGLGADDALELTALDADSRALAILSALTEAAGRSRGLAALPRLHLRTAVFDLGEPAALPAGPFDLVTAGFVLNELPAAGDEAAATERAAALLTTLASRLAPDGALVVLEPALATTARALQRARDRLLATAPAGVCVFAPCLHAEPCPLLARERDWCHEDEPGALPPPLASVARGAGLRFEGLTFSYLTLRRDGRTLRDAMAARTTGIDEPALLRVVSSARASKGKTELDVCGAGKRTVLAELRRDTGKRPALAACGRGDVLWLGPAPGGERVRLGPGIEHVRARPCAPGVRSS